ncbi:MAG TPA: hypothetical protein GX707_15785 [Epulopiscium sp.]|nr:hypothetical protein [Candidatus Epulonipiscium sp.]
MERLISRIKDNVYYPKGEYTPTTLCAEMTTSEVRECMSKLAEYEDLGMTPNEVYKTIKAGVPEWIPKYLEYRELEKQGLLIKLPCNVGDEVVIIFNEYGELFLTNGWRVAEITITDNDTIFKFECCVPNDEEERSLKDFGKTVFLTEQEAKKALENLIGEQKGVRRE